MNEKEIDELNDLIQKKIPINKEKLESILDFVNTENITKNILTKSILIRNTGDSIREDDFLHMIYEHIVPFVLDYDEYQNKSSLSGSELASKYLQIINNAKSKFQRKNELTGEIGELILFLLLESEGITKLVSKMRLKTNSEMPVFGADAVHIEAKSGELIFHFGESKMYNNFNDALTSAISSDENLKGKSESTEFDIISKHIDHNKFEKYDDLILDYLDPYFKNKENMKKSYPVFIGYDWQILQNLLNRGKSSLTNFLHIEYSKEIQQNKEKILKKVTTSEIKERNFRFFVLPFVDVGEFRKSFLEMM